MMTAMNPRPLLIVSSSLVADSLCRPPFNLDPEAFLLTRLESLKWLGFARFSAIILHEPPTELLAKLALGLRDNSDLEALWSLFKDPLGPQVRAMSLAPAAPPRPWIDLGLEPILPSELASLADSIPTPGTGPVSAQPRNALTADDIRELYQKGIKTIPSDRPLTDWAREIAASLGMASDSSESSFILWAVKAVTRKDLQSQGEKFFRAAQALPSLLFVLSPPHIPIFQEFFPSLKSRVVSANAHWASHGAFTGEVSIGMLADLGCRGAILSNRPPHNSPDHQSEISKQAHVHGLNIFSICDIMARRSGSPKPDRAFIPLCRIGESRSGAVLVNDQELEQILMQKGRR
ncbi:hypothetical protein AUK22_04355 [bacterium CG2_30_54_10]|nr:MAG: hypothetical protein AUK22_04355 [bacterium CG2_30_54_10]